MYSAASGRFLRALPRIGCGTLRGRDAFPALGECKGIPRVWFRFRRVRPPGSGFETASLPPAIGYSWRKSNRIHLLWQGIWTLSHPQFRTARASYCGVLDPQFLAADRKRKGYGGIRRLQRPFVQLADEGKITSGAIEGTRYSFPGRSSCTSWWSPSELRGIRCSASSSSLGRGVKSNNRCVNCGRRAMRPELLLRVTATAKTWWRRWRESKSHAGGEGGSFRLRLAIRIARRENWSGRNGMTGEGRCLCQGESVAVQREGPPRCCSMASMAERIWRSERTHSSCGSPPTSRNFNF